jgi:hypothetical protein
MTIFWVCFEAPDFASQVFADRPMVLQIALRDIERFCMSLGRLQHNALLFLSYRPLVWQLLVLHLVVLFPQGNKNCAKQREEIHKNWHQENPNMLDVLGL